MRQIEAAGLPAPERQSRLVDGRRFQTDLVWRGAGQMVTVEVEGGTWVRGRHTRPQGFENDCEKYNAVELQHNPISLRVTGGMVKDGRALTFIRQALAKALGRAP